MLEHKLEKEKLEREEEDRRRQGLGALITYLKKVNKDQIRRVHDTEVSRECAGHWGGLTCKSQVFGGMEERVSLVKGSAKVVLYAIIRYM